MTVSKKLAFTLISPLVGLALAEALARGLDWEPVPRPVSRGVLFQPSLVSGLTFENRPGAQRWIEYRDAEGSEPRTVSHTVNADGLRGPERSRERRAGTLRIACIGDSHTFGTGVGEVSSWPRQLETLFAEEGSTGREVEVLNAGVSAYDTRREVLHLRHRVLPFQPDLVLLQYHVNDTSPRNVLGWKAPEQDWLRELASPERADWVATLRSWSRMADLTLGRLYGYRVARDECGLSMESYAEDHAGWLRVQAALREARDLLRERGTAFGVVLFPYLLRDSAGLTSDAAFERVTRFCAAEGIPYLDASDAFRDQDVNALRVHALDFHANERAYALFSAAVHAWLSRGAGQGLLPPVGAGAEPAASERMQ